MAQDNYQMGSVNLRTRAALGPGNRVAEKPKDFRHTLADLIRYCSRSVLLLIAALACAAGGAVFTLVGPGRLSTITDMISDGIDTGQIDLGAIISISATLMGYYILSFVLTYGETFLLVTLSQKTAKRMRSDISRKLGKIPLSDFDRSSFGDLISRMTNDVDSVADGLRMGVGDVVNAAALFIGAVILMLLTNWILALLAIGASLIGFLLMTLITRHSQPYFRDQSVELGIINGHIEEVYAGHQVVKTYNGEEAAKAQFHEMNRKLYESVWKSQFLSGIMNPIMTFVGNLGYVAVCVAGAVMTAQGTITFGVIVAFIVYVKLFTQPLGMLAQAVTTLQSAIAAAERIFGFLDEPEMEDESDKITDFRPPRGRVEFDHVTFGYVKNHPILKDFSVDIPPGAQVAIVGPTGAGKTTLVNLLMRFYEVDGGQIRIDGRDIRELTRENVHDLFGMVLQDTWIFEDTIRANVAYGRPDVADREVEEACRAVGLHAYIMSLPDGYDTILKDDASLSAGQRQLMTIARAMVADQPLLILDEATSSVDTRTEQLVQNAMLRLTKGRTSFTIAHRLSTIRQADIILVMKDGNIIEKGTHRELLSRGGFYADLWESQFAGKAI